LAGAAASVQQLAAAANENKPAARKPRTIYFNDARHYYLFVFEPPMNLLDAWRPIDEVAGTAVDTFIYGVERGDGLFYPSKVGMRFGEDMRPFSFAAYWRVWQNMQSLIDRGLDPLKVLVDRAHSKDMEFFASLRMSSYGGMKPEFRVPEGGRGMAHREVRDHQFEVLEELVTAYDIEGVELDFAAAPGGMPLIVRKEEARDFTPVMTDYVKKISQMVRGRRGRAGLIGARVYPTDLMNLSHGLDVREWLKQRLVDFVVPMFYLDFTLDPDMPFEWLVEAAHEADVSVYGMLMPYFANQETGSPVAIHATPQQMRAAAANYWDRGVDGLYTWFMRWPLGNAERRTLTELGDRELIQESDKHYVLHRRSAQAAEMGYDSHLPLEFPSADPAKRYTIPFSIADDIERSKGRVRRVQLRLRIDNMVSGDRLTVRLNGKSLADETCLRAFGNQHSPYEGQWLEFALKENHPRKGQNALEFSLDSRPNGLEGGVSIQNVELLVEYGPFPSGLNE
jgi:hypothetical protein